YGLLARERLGEVSDDPAPFPPARTLPPGGLPAPLAVAAELATLGFLSEASAEADWFVQHHAGDAGVAALPIYERAGRADRAVLFAIALLGDRGPRAPRVILEGAYPAAFPAQVARAAERTGIDPYLVLAVTRRNALGGARCRAAARRVGGEHSVSRDAQVREGGDRGVERVQDSRGRIGASALGDGAGAEVWSQLLTLQKLLLIGGRLERFQDR